MKILILRMSAFGDIIMASGILPPIKKAYPDSTIFWMTQKEYEPLLSNSPYIDQIIPINRKKIEMAFKKRKIGEFVTLVKRYIKELRQYNFDLVLDLQGIWKSGVWAFFSRSRKKIVVDPKEGCGFLYTKKIISNPQDKKIGAEYKLILKHLGISDKEYGFGLGEVPDVLNLKEKYVVFCPFTTRPQKFWIDNYWKELQQGFKQKGFKIAVLGGKGDIKRFTKIFSDDSKMINLVGKLDILESLGVIKHSSGVVGVDTGLTHAAMLFNKRVVAIFGSTCPYFDTGYEAGKVLYKKLPCSPCKRNPTCDNKFTCMKNISPQQVLDAFFEISS